MTTLGIVVGVLLAGLVGFFLGEIHRAIKNAEFDPKVDQALKLKVRLRGITKNAQV